MWGVTGRVEDERVVSRRRSVCSTVTVLVGTLVVTADSIDLPL